MGNEDYTNMLLNKLEELKSDIDEFQKRVQAIFDQIDHKQKQAQHIIELLKIEGIEPNKDKLESLGQVSVADLAYQNLSQKDSHQPIHYRELANTIMADGNLIPGKDPAANLLSHISRDERFVRVASGTYGLSEWGLEPAAKPKRRKRRKPISR